MVTTPLRRVRPGESIVVAYAPEDAVWAQWLRQVLTGAGLEVRIRRVDAEPTGLDVGALVLLVISDHLLRGVSRSSGFWDSYVAESFGGAPNPIAVIVGTGQVPPEAESMAAVDLRMLPDDVRARSKVLRALSRDDQVSVPATLGQADSARVLYPGRQVFADYRSTSLPQHQPEWFYGREHEIDEIGRCLDNSGAAVLTGAAGVGKSWLAAAYVRRYRSQYDLIAWIPGENGAVLRTELGRLAGSLGMSDPLPPDTGYRDVVEALRKSDLRYLLVYDNVTPDHYRTAAELPLPRKPALLSEVVPWGGPGHVLFTSKVSDWSEPQRISVPLFTLAEGSDFLLRHVQRLTDELADEFSQVLEGSPVLLNALARRGSRDTDEIDQRLLAKVRAAPFTVLRGEPVYKRASSIFGDSLRPLLDEPVGSDGWAAGQLLRLLTAFPADQPISLALLTSELAGSERGNGCRLPEELAAALANENRRRRVLELATRDSVAQICADPITGSGRALAMHAVPWFGIRDFLPKDVADTNQHIAHQLLCDADPQRTDLPQYWSRYLWLWQQVAHTEVLSCTRVANPDDPCARLPRLIRNLVRASRMQGEVTAASGLGTQAAQAWAEQLGADDIGVVQIRIGTGNTLWQMGKWQEALTVAVAARSGVEPRRAEFPEAYVLSSDLVAASLRMAGDWAGAVPINEDSHAWARECLGDNHVETYRAAHNLAVAYRMVGRFADAMVLDTANYEGLQNDLMLPGDAILTLHCLNNIARNHRELGKYEESVALQERVLSRFEELMRELREQNLLRGRKNMAVSLRKSGCYRQALVMQREVLREHVLVYGSDHPESIASRTNVANDYRVTGDLDQALDHANTAYRLCSALRPDHPYTAACAVNYAAALRAVERIPEALAADQAGIDIFTRRLTADHPYTLAAQTGKASDLAALGRLEEAAELGAETLGRSHVVRGPDHPYTLQCAINLALDLRELGRIDDADALERDTLDRYVATLGSEHPEVEAAFGRVRGTCDVEPPPM